MTNDVDCSDYRLSSQDEVRLDTACSHLADANVVSALATVSRLEEPTAQTLGLLLAAERLRADGLEQAYAKVVVRAATMLSRDPPTLVVSERHPQPELLVIDVIRVLWRLGGAGRARSIVSRLRERAVASMRDDPAMGRWAFERLDAVRVELGDEAGLTGIRWRAPVTRLPAARLDIAS